MRAKILDETVARRPVAPPVVYPPREFRSVQSRDEVGRP